MSTATHNHRFSQNGNGHAHVELLDAPPARRSEASEVALVGSAILDGSIVENIDERELYDPYHRAVIVASRNVLGTGRKLDILLLDAELRKLTMAPPEGGWRALLLALSTNVPHAANWQGYYDDVKADARRRKLHEQSIRMAQAAHGHDPIDKALPIVREAIEEIERGGIEDVCRIEPIGAHDFDSATYQTDYLVPNVLAKWQPAIVAGGSKAGKTTIVTDLAISLAADVPFLGYYRTSGSYRTMLMSGESGLPVLQETARRICKAAGIWLDDLEGQLYFSGDVPKLGNPQSLRAVDNLLTEYAIEVLIIDPLYLALPGNDAGNLYIQGQYLRTVGELCQKHGTTLVLVHHTRKNVGGNPFDPPELADIAWSGCQEFARQWLLIGRRERYEPGSGTHRLWLNVGGSAGHSGCWAIDIEEGTNDASQGRSWDVSVSSAGEARAEATARAAEAKAQDREAKAQATVESYIDSIRAALTQAPEGETRTGLRTATGINLERIDGALAVMLQRHEVESCKVVKPPQKKAQDGFKLTQIEHPVHPGQDIPYTVSGT